MEMAPAKYQLPRRGLTQQLVLSSRSATQQKRVTRGHASPGHRFVGMGTELRPELRAHFSGEQVTE